MATDKKINTWELCRLAYSITADLMETEGIVTDEIEEKIRQFGEDAQDKLEAQRHMRNHSLVLARSIRDEAARLVGVARRFEAIAARAEGGARNVLLAKVEKDGWKQGRQQTTPDGLIYLKKIRKLQITAADKKRLAPLLAGSDWVNEKTTHSLDTRKIKDRLEADDAELRERLDALDAKEVRVVDAYSVIFDGPKKEDKADQS